jgi:hypothetical protein
VLPAARYDAALVSFDAWSFGALADDAPVRRDRDGRGESAPEPAEVDRGGLAHLSALSTHSTIPG